MKLNVARLVEPKYFALHSIQRLFHDAFTKSPVYPGGFETMVDDMLDLVKNPAAHILIGVEDDIPKALLIIILPTSSITPLPQIMHIYNVGSLGLRKKLLKAGVAIVKGAGYMRVWAINATGKPDSLWSRSFRVLGPSRSIGSIMELDI